jgi:hypothetical protein
VKNGNVEFFALHRNHRAMGIGPEYGRKWGVGAFPDHSEIMVLALQLYDVYRETILGFASKKGAVR